MRFPSISFIVIWIQAIYQIHSAVVLKSVTDNHHHQIGYDDDSWFLLKTEKVTNFTFDGHTTHKPVCKKQENCRFKRDEDGEGDAVKAVSDDDNSSEISQLFEEAFGLKGSINAVFKFTNFVIKRKQEGTLSDTIKKSFERVDFRMQSIDTSLNKLLSEKALKDRFFQYEEVIRNSLRYAKAYLKAACEISIAANGTVMIANGTSSMDTAKTNLISFGQKLLDSLFTIFDGLLNQNAFASDILDSTMNMNQRHLAKFQRDSRRYLDLMRFGTFALSVYFEAINYPENEGENRIQELLMLEKLTIERIALFEEECKNEKNVVNEMRDIMSNSNSKATIDNIVNSIYKYLADKYSTKNWFVMVYKNIINNPDREKMSRAFHLVVGERGYNAAAISFEESCKYQRTDLLSGRLKSYCSKDSSSFSGKSRYVKSSYLNPVCWFVCPFITKITCLHYKAHIIYKQLKDYDNCLREAQLAVVVVEKNGFRSAGVEGLHHAKYFSWNEYETSHVFAFLCN